MKLGSHKLTFQLKWEFLEILCKVAESYPPSTDRGECWDFVAFALNDAQAKWNNYDVYGKIYSDQTKIKAGDVL